VNDFGVMQAGGGEGGGINIEHGFRNEIAANTFRGNSIDVSLWDDDDGFFYDRLKLPDGRSQLMRVRSIVGLIPPYINGRIVDELFHQLAAHRAELTLLDVGTGGADIPASSRTWSSRPGAASNVAR
jgi:hypothetical protein